MPVYTVFNSAMATTAVTARPTTGTAIKTMLQIATPSTRQIQLISWGWTIDASAAGTAYGNIELIQTDVAATVTAHVAAGVQPIDPNAPASLMTLGTSATGYTASAEGTTAASRVFDLASSGGVSNGPGPNVYSYQWMPDERPIVAISKFLRVRASMTVAVSLSCWVRFLE